MIKRTLIAIAVVALLATSAHAALTEHYFPNAGGDHKMVKVDGNEKIRWPFEYKYLTVCEIPLKMSVGMYVQIFECKKKKIILKQVECGDLKDNGDGDFPCYKGCVKFEVRGNFPTGIKMGAAVNKGDILDKERTYYVGGDVVPGDGEYHEVELCVEAWKVKIWKGVPGDEIDVGTVSVQVKPN